MFARAYVDNEESDEEEKKARTKAARSRESLPFGMNIRQAAHKAAFGRTNHVLQRYATFRDGDKRRTSEDEGLDILLDVDESDSVSDSASSDSLSMDSIDVDPTQITTG